MDHVWGNPRAIRFSYQGFIYVQSVNWVVATSSSMPVLNFLSDKPLGAPNALLSYVYKGDAESSFVDALRTFCGFPIRF